MTLMVVTRGVFVFMDQYTLSEAASVFFDIGFGIIGAVLEPFFEPEITTDLPQADKSITDYALAVRVASFLWPLISSAGGIKDLYCDNYWPSPATLKAINEKKKTIQKRGAKIVIFVLQLRRASVYVIMAHPAWCHDFRPASARPHAILSRAEFSVAWRSTTTSSASGDGANKMQPRGDDLGRRRQEVALADQHQDADAVHQVRRQGLRRSQV